MNSERHPVEEEKEVDEFEEYFNARSFKSRRSLSFAIQRPIKNLFAQQWWKFAIVAVIKENRFKKGQWNEFKITSWRKKEYAKHLARVSYPRITPEYIIDTSQMPAEDELLIRHIFEASDMNDL
jgi:hypothetical protein